MQQLLSPTFSPHTKGTWLLCGSTRPGLIDDSIQPTEDQSLSQIYTLSLTVLKRSLRFPLKRLPVNEPLF